MLLVAGAVAGIAVTFLPLSSRSVAIEAGFSIGISGQERQRVLDDWRGVVCLVGYVAALVLAFVLYRPRGLRHSVLCWAAVGVGVLNLVLAVWLVVRVLQSSHGAEVMGLSVRNEATLGVGAILNVLTAAVVTAAGFLKERHERLI
jgi:hypothetical protein